MERNCVTTFVVASEFANDGGVLGLEPSLVGRASWTWACWPGFDIVWVSVEVATAVPNEGSDRSWGYTIYRAIICYAGWKDRMYKPRVLSCVISAPGFMGVPRT